MSIHPITYSLIINIVTLAIAGALAFVTSQPWLFVVAVLLCTHMPERFRNDRRNEADDKDDEDEPPEPSMGFFADPHK